MRDRGDDAVKGLQPQERRSIQVNASDVEFYAAKCVACPRIRRGLGRCENPPIVIGRSKSGSCGEVTPLRHGACLNELLVFALGIRWLAAKGLSNTSGRWSGCPTPCAARVTNICGLRDLDGDCTCSYGVSRIFTHANQHGEEDTETPYSLHGMRGTGVRPSISRNTGVRGCPAICCVCGSPCCPEDLPRRLTNFIPTAALW